MVTDRISALFQPAGKRFSILYGPGIEDTFLSGDLQELRLELALLAALKENGFNRVAFTAPHRPVFFLDDESRQLTFGDSIFDNNPDRRNFNSEMIFLNGGPLHNRLLIHPGTLSPTNGGMGDAHAIRLLDSLMQDANGVRTAVVFLQAESLIRYFQEGRTLAGILGEWTRLPRSNLNRCIFCFSADTYEELLSTGKNLPVPEIRTIINRNNRMLNESANLFRVGSPGKDEIQNLLELYEQQGFIQINPDDRPGLARWMSAEDCLLIGWAARLNSISYLDFKTARQQGWFSAVRNNDQTAEEQLIRLAGLKNVKERVAELAAWLQIERQRQGTSARAGDPPSLHMIFTGNPGTGKTTIARLFGEILHDLGYLKRGHLVEVTGRDLIAGHVGGTALKTHTVIDQALDGVLFIDEAYTLTESERGGFGQEALDALLTRMEDERGRLVVIAAGYSEKMENFRRLNPGLNRRFPVENILHFEDFSPEELWAILVNFLKSRSLVPDQTTRKALKEILTGLWKKRDRTFGNAGEMRNLAEAIDRRRALRLANLPEPDSNASPRQPVILEDIPEYYRRFLLPIQSQIEDVLEELNDLAGLEPVKDYLNNLVHRIHLDRLRKEHLPDFSPASPIRHLVFVGSPGTGKTTVARLVGKIYHSLGLLTGGQCVEVSRSDLVAGYVGQTAQKTMACVERAIDGVLFIDEAYSLNGQSGNDFGKEAIDTLVKAIEDYKDRLVVILAGYPDEINRLIRSNPGLKSRFATPLVFPDLSGEQMGQILEILAKKERFTLPEKIKGLAVDTLLSHRQASPASFGNARAVLDLFDQMKNNLARRVMKTIQLRNDATLENGVIVFEIEDVPDPLYLIELAPFSQKWKKASEHERPSGSIGNIFPEVTDGRSGAPEPAEEFPEDGDTIPGVPGGPGDPPASPDPERYQSPGSNTG
jgi:SpoVK/Ycf46/Vps4 family AAA+-type ATPase